ncbi:hypothetical protein Tco_1161417, partial [Tanacetum coccineum]
GESLSEAWARFKDLLQKVPHHGVDFWLKIQIFYDHVSFHLKSEIDRAASSKLRDRNAEESLEIIENLSLYDHEGWNDPRDFTKSVKKEEVEDGTNDEPVRSMNGGLMGEKVEELVEMPRSQPIGFYLKQKINKELIEGLVENERFNDSLLAVQLGKMERKAYDSLPIGPIHNAMLKKKDNQKRGHERVNLHKILDFLCKIKEEAENDIDPVTPTSTVIFDDEKLWSSSEFHMDESWMTI